MKKLIILLGSAEFKIKTLNGETFVKGKILELPSGEKVGVYKTGRKEFFEKAYKPCWSVTCLKTGYSLITLGTLKYILSEECARYRQSIRDIIGRRLNKYKYILKAQKQMGLLNDLRRLKIKYVKPLTNKGLKRVPEKQK
jgi:hypothetical protein